MGSRQVDGGSAAIVLAAGQGTRMGARLPKPLVPVAGRPILFRLLDSVRRAGIDRISVVVGHRAGEVRAALGPEVGTPLQAEPLGTAHAVECARASVGGARRVFVLMGDSPLVRPRSLARLQAQHRGSGGACSFLTATFERPYPYARVIRDAAGRVVDCVEEPDATPAQRRIREYLTSHYLFEAEALWRVLPRIAPHPASGERQLTWAIGVLVAMGESVRAVEIDDWRELVGLNTPDDVAWAEALLEGRAGRKRDALRERLR